MKATAAGTATERRDEPRTTEPGRASTTRRAIVRAVSVMAARRRAEEVEW